MPVGIACALVGVIIGILTLTGAATLLAGYIIDIGKNSLFLSLVLTMLVCLVLGMGIPTIPNYIITSSLAAPALLELGVPLIVSHMFVFYFGIMADLTPPVALAAFAAAPIAKESGMKIGFQAMRVAIAGFIVPYMAVYAPALMLQGGTWWDTGYVVIKAVVAITLWGGTAIGFWLAPLSWFERLWAFVAAAFLVVAAPATDEIGLAMTVALVVWHGVRLRRTARVHGLRAGAALVGGAVPVGRRRSAELAAAGLHAALGALDREDRVVRGLSRGRWLAAAATRPRRGSGAGMEPPDGAVLAAGAWHYRPADGWRREVVLARSTYVRDYDLCFDSHCQPLSDWLPVSAGPTTLRACTRDDLPS